MASRKGFGISMYIDSIAKVKQAWMSFVTPQYIKNIYIYITFLLQFWNAVVYSLLQLISVFLMDQFERNGQWVYIYNYNEFVFALPIQQLGSMSIFDDSGAVHPLKAFGWSHQVCES